MLKSNISMPKPKILLNGLAMPESARWHEGRLWFAHWGTGEIVAVDLNGKSEVITRNAPPAFGWSIDWLPDGRLLVTGEELMRMEKDGTMVRHADRIYSPRENIIEKKGVRGGRGRTTFNRGH
jgi:sugar lactone lactonase YvrE